MNPLFDTTPMQFPFPYCCRYKERGVMFCHEGETCICKCHGVEAPHTPASQALVDAVTELR